MAVTYNRFLVTIPMQSALPADSVVHNWYWKIDDGALPGKYLTVWSALLGFYDDIAGGLATQIDRENLSVKVYNLADSEPRVPVYTDDGAISEPGASGTIDLPNEVAMAFSYQGAAVSGLDQARRRGRIFLGPLRWYTSVGGAYRPSAGHINDAKAAAETLLAFSDSDEDVEWCVFSPKNAGGPFADPEEAGPPNLAAAFVPITNGWVDNAWDTQRRRGLEPTSRTLWS